MSKSVENKVAELVAGEMGAAGYDLVRVHISGGGKYAALQIMGERQDRAGMTVEDCAAISKIVTAKLEADAALADKYDLEVSSPGIDRPLMKLQDYARFLGHVAKVELNTPVEGKKRFQGRITQTFETGIEFDVEKAALKVPFAQIERAKLVLTDELLKAAASGKVSH